jgi:hypothetical protein
MSDQYAMTYVEQERLTLHHTSMVCSEPETVLCDFHVDLICEADRLEELI